MATYTPNLKLEKPTYTDYVEIPTINVNIDKIDQAYQELVQRIKALEDAQKA